MVVRCVDKNRSTGNWSLRYHLNRSMDKTKDMEADFRRSKTQPGPSAPWVKKNEVVDRYKLDWSTIINAVYKKGKRCCGS